VQHYYFHLVDGHDVIPDEVGIEVTDLTQARVEATNAIGEFLRDCADTRAASQDWRIEVTDPWGAVALRINLSEFAENG
jgi:hypothetical protein